MRCYLNGNGKDVVTIFFALNLKHFQTLLINIFEQNNFTMNNINYEALNVFIEGMKSDWAQHAESSKSYNYGKNGRLYSHDGVVSFSSIQGTKEVYRNNFIAKYIGACAFEDELILFAKADREKISETGNQNDDFLIVTKEKLKASYIEHSLDSVQIENVIDFDPFIANLTVQEIIATEDSSPITFNVPFSEIENTNEIVDVSNYFEEIFSSVNYTLCDISGSSSSSDSDYIDCIFSLKINEDGEIEDKLLWSGNLNLDLNSKIVTFGVHENNFYKRVYFTDYKNYFRVINLKDPIFPNRKASEFSTFQNVAMLRPQVSSIGNKGQIKAGTVIYSYRLITQNGQITEFSPMSEDVKILVDNTDEGYHGGNISQTTTKNVVVKCNLINYKDFNEIECIVIEYEAKGSPTAIRSLGIKKVAPVVYFNHYGNESEFGTNLTLSDILIRKNTWKYCSDITSKSNMLIASGLRNEPIPSGISGINHLFALHAWDAQGDTFNSYINPDPTKYNLINPNNNQKMFNIEAKLYNSIQAFESFEVKLVNKSNNKSVSTFITEKQKLNYVEYLDDIYSWLNSIKNTSEFTTAFPGVKVEMVQNKILFSKNSESVNFDFSNIEFEYSTTQVIEDYINDVKLQNLSISGGNLIHGYQSLGFNQGSGIRITFKTENNELATMAQAQQSTPLINLKKPTTKKYFFKGEIYRVGLQVWLKDGTTPFVIPVGDIKIPDMDENITEIDDNGNPVRKFEKYQNSRVIGNKLYSEGICLNVEVRLSCELQKAISMYQIVYVERDEDNRTILCQGISAPLERTNNFWHTEFVNLPEPVNCKWNLPFMGGPNYDHQGLITGDANINQDDRWLAQNRVVTNRSMFYFDAPDVIFNLISADKIKNGKVSVIKRLNHDQNRYSTYTGEPEKFPAFSRTITYSQIDAGENEKPYGVIFSMMMESNANKKEYEIEFSERFNSGEIKSYAAFDSKFDVSNNALTLAYPAWYYLDVTRADEKCNNVNNAGTALHYELLKSANFAVGNDTVIIKTTNKVFDNLFISQQPIKLNAHKFIHPKLNYYGIFGVVDTHALINIQINNKDSVYGGRSESAYSKNVYTPLSDTIPVLKTSNNIQRFRVYGDTYVSLFMRNKTMFNDGGVTKHRMETYSNCGNDYEVENYTRKGAWTYGVVVETMIEPRWTYDNMFYSNTSSFNFSQSRKGNINEAYLQTNNLKSYIPKPYNFKDDPNLSNIVAISDPKLSGSSYDAFSSFRVNNFYELEKNKGVAYNLAKFLDNIYVVQENQTSQLLINENVMVASSQGEVSVKEGTGNRISGHKVISDYGTSIRRAIIESMSNDQEIGGFSFIDEKRFEWIKSIKPLLVEKDLQLKFREIFEQDPIVDTEGYYDDEHKETNIRIITKSGLRFMLSFNERLQVFNGWMEIDSNIFMMWKNNVFAPNLEENSTTIHQLNKGDVMKVFNDQKNLIIEYTVNVNPQTVKIFKAWSATINTKYPIKSITVKTSNGQERVILGNHERYQIHERNHNVPLKNATDWDDLRGEWAQIKVEVESLDNQKIDIFSFVNFVRHSNL